MHLQRSHNVLIWFVLTFPWIGPSKKNSVISVLQKLIWFQKYEHHFRHFFHFYPVWPEYFRSFRKRLTQKTNCSIFHHWMSGHCKQFVFYLRWTEIIERIQSINEQKKPEKMKHPSLWLWLRNIMLNLREKKKTKQTPRFKPQNIQIFEHNGKQTVYFLECLSHVQSNTVHQINLLEIHVKSLSSYVTILLYIHLSQWGILFHSNVSLFKNFIMTFHHQNVQIHSWTFVLTNPNNVLIIFNFSWDLQNLSAFSKKKPQTK